LTSAELTGGPNATFGSASQHAMKGPAEGEAAGMVAELRQENLRLRQQLQALTRDAEKNAAIFQRFHALELSLLHSGSLPELLERIVNRTREILGLDEVTLIIHDPEHEVRNLLATSGLEVPISPGVRLIDRPPSGNAAYGRLLGPWLGPFRDEHLELFRRDRRFGSVALLPLVAQGCLFGSLNLASADPDRYTRRHSSDFHCRLAGVAALCLQNVVDRERLVVDGYTDRLTRWKNRRYLDTRLPQEVARALRYGESLSCLILDVDHFKQINDRYGHPSGDAVLQEIAGRIKGHLRSSDLAVRFGGEEFVVFLIHANVEKAAAIGERIRHCIADTPFSVRGGLRLRVTISGGVAELKGGDSADDPAAIAAATLHRADTALYRAKSEGRNRIVCDDSS
jgi:diguanylate cyclase (GGDEF)-like protein